MPRPKRRGIQDDAFDDPLSNYSPPTYEDTLHRALCEDPITQMKHQPFTCIEASSSIIQVLKQMEQKNIACVMVTENDRLAGIFSERDVLDKVADRFEEIRDQPVRTVMTPEPVAVRGTDTLAKALAVMAVGGFRHVPILDPDDKVIGMIGPRRVNTYLRTHLGKAEA